MPSLKPPELSSSLVDGRFTYHLSTPAWSPDGTRFVVGDLSGNLCVFEQQSGRFVPSVTLHDPPAKAYAGPQVRSVSWPQAAHIVSVERAHTVQRRPSDLAETAVAENVGHGMIVSGGNGAWVALQSVTSSAIVLDVPGLTRRFWPSIGHHDFSGPQLTALAADPRRDVFAGSGDGGSEETAMAMPLEQGRARTDLVDVASQRTIATIDVSARCLAFDPWRRELLVGGWGSEVRCYTYDGAPVRTFDVGEDIRAIAVTERWIITGASSGAEGTLALWDPETLERVASAPHDRYTLLEWIVPSPDGSRFLTQAKADKRFPLRVWHIAPQPSCSICSEIPSGIVANTGRDIYLPATVRPLKALDFGRDEDLWRCPECDAIYEYTSEQSWTGSGNNDNDTLERLPDDHAATVRTLLGDVGTPLDDDGLRALFALPPLSQKLVLQRLLARRPAVLRGAVGRMVAQLAPMGFSPGFQDPQHFLKTIAALSHDDAERVKAAIAATTYTLPHPFEKLLADIG